MLDELPSVLWVYRTMTRTPTGKTPFRLAFRGEAIILVQIGLTSYKVAHHDEHRNEEGIQL